MSRSDTVAPDVQSSHRIWALALAVAAVAAALTLIGLALSLFEDNHWASPSNRTLPALLAFLPKLGILTVCAALILLRRRFIQLQRRGQTLALVVVLFLVAGLAGITTLLLKMALTARPVIPYTPRLAVRYQHMSPGQDDAVVFDLRGAVGRVGGGRWNGSLFTFDEKWYEHGLVRSEQPSIECRGSLATREGDGVAISFDLQAKQELRLEVDGLRNVQVHVGGRLLQEPFELAPGQHTVVISGQR